MADNDVGAMSQDELLRLLVEQADEHALVILDPEGTIVGWLAGAESIFGYTADEVLGRRHDILFTPEDRAAGAADMELKIVRSGRPAEDDRWMQRKDGVRFWATGVLQGIMCDGRLAGFGKVLRNRTDLRAHLEGLEQEAEHLRSGDQRKNAFISTLSHELRNPLGSIATAAEVLRRHLPAGEDAAFAMEVIGRQVEAMRRLVDDLLDVTRISTGKLKLELTLASLGDILSAAAETCRPAIENDSRHFKLLMTDAHVPVMADSQRLQQVFVNLIENSVKYTKPGGSVWVKALVEGQEAVVKVEDDGLGIAPEVLPRIFDLFTQAELAEERPRAGLGIGLSVVKDITQLHGGSVQVRSDGVGKGSEFIVRLPLAGPMADRPNTPGGRAGED